MLVDGANNWLFENYATFGNPDLICGDMDSISREALEFFERKLPSSSIVKLPNQDETDFDKSLSFCLTKFDTQSIDHLVAIWGQAGRIDHNLSCISTLIKHNNRASLPIYLIDVNSSLSCVLNQTKRIKINPRSQWCSIVPVGEPAKVSTTGFKWNLTDYVLKFGELISTSNEFNPDKDYCTVQSDRPVFFSMHLPE